MSFLLVSCDNRQTKSLLQDVETYIQERPDSALRVLRKVDSLTLNTKSLRARYSVLFAMALDKNYIDTTALSILEPTVAYYEKFGSPKDKMLSYYYLGRIYSNRKDYPNAVIYYLQALRESSEDDYYHRGLIFEAATDAYNASFNDEEELRNSILAYECFEKIGDKDLDLSLYKVAQAYHNNERFDVADSLYSLVYSGKDSTSRLALYAMEDLVSNDLYQEKQDVERDLELLEYVAEHRGNLSLESYYEYAYLLLLAGKESEAENILSQLSNRETNGKTMEIRYRIAECKGQYEEALALLKSMLSHQNDVVKKKLAQSVFKAQSDYYRLTAEVSEQKSTISNQRSIIILITGLMIIALLYVIFMKRKSTLIREKDRLTQAVEESERLLETVRNRANEEKSEREKDILDLKSRNEREQDKIKDLREMYVALYQKRFSEIGKYYDAASSHRLESIKEKAYHDVISSTQALFEEIASGSEGQKKFEARINADLDDIVSKIRSDFPKLKDDDIRFICYLIVGFDTSTISFLMDITKENVRVKKHRLREKLNGYSGPNETLYRLFT
uniref:tetratricopeptide repeat protein n=1 Tax=Candidatus Cryptobacteroides bacterium TaxID=3085639 RepID=UPI004025476F